MPDRQPPDASRSPDAHGPPVHHPWDRFRQTLIEFDWTKVNAARGLRNAVGVALPLAIGAMTGHVEAALVMATGALNVGFADTTEPYLPRVKRMLTAGLLVALAVFLGSTSGWTLPSALAAAAVCSFGCGMLVSLGTQPGNIGVSTTCVLLIFASHPLPARDASLCGLLALGGGLVQILLSALLWPVRSDEPERLALASLYLGLARVSRQSVATTEGPPGTSRATATSEALAARQGDHSPRSERYRALMDQGERIRVCLLTLGALRERLDAPEGNAGPAIAPLLDEFRAAAKEGLNSIGEMLRTGRPWSGEPAPVVEPDRLLDAFRALPATDHSGPLIADIGAQMDALARRLRVAFDLANNTTRSGELAMARKEAARPLRLRPSGPLNTLRANLSLNSTAFRHALRLAVCVTAADAMGRMFGWYRPYWFPLTVTVVLKPDFSSTFSRGVLRLAGTFLGLGLATALFHLLPQTAPVEIGLIAAATFILRWSGPAHYGVLAVSVSELVVLLVALNGVMPGPVILARARSTALGGCLALLAYWLWPTWERTQVAETFARMLDAYRAHFALMTEAFSGEPPELTAAMDRTRFAARLSRTNLEASVDRLATEPGTTPEERDRWQAMLASSHIFAHSMIALHAALYASRDSMRALGQSPAFRDFVRAVLETLNLLASLLRNEGETSGPFPDLRQAHYRLASSGEPMAARHTLIDVETDRMVNSLNTLREQVLRNSAKER